VKCLILLGTLGRGAGPPITARLDHRLSQGMLECVGIDAVQYIYGWSCIDPLMLLNFKYCSFKTRQKYQWNYASSMHIH